MKFLIVVLCLGLASSGTAAKRKKEAPASEVQSQAQALIEKARRLSDIRADGAPAFRLKAIFSSNGKNLETLQGTYTEVWVSKSQWWREISVNGLRRVEIGGSDRRWVLDGGPDFPATARHLPDLMNVFPRNPLKFEFQSIAENTSGNLEAECAIGKPFAGNQRYAFCFEKQSGLLVEKTYPEIRPMNSVSFGCLYGSFRKFGDLWYPREMECREDTHRVLEAKVIELLPEPSPSPELFIPPQGAVDHRQCDGSAQPPKVVSSPEPSYPSGANAQYAFVTLSVLVDLDGRPRNVMTKESSSKPFEKPAIDAVSRWKFRPGTCDGQPMAMEIAIQIEFRR